MEKQTEVEDDRTLIEPICVRLPRFLIEDEVGLGDVIKRTTNAIGIKPCDGCHRRADP
jgi:hypothetical protein